MRSAIKQYFGITKKEWNGMVVLVVIVLMVWLAPNVYSYWHKDDTTDLADFNKTLALLKASKSTEANTDDTDDDIDLDARRAHPVMFAFNPNKLPDSLWLKLGLSLRQIQSIKNYEHKGGHFYTKADVQKMYSLSPADYARLEPYINIPERGFKPKLDGVVLEINSADSAVLTQIRGIGPAFAQRIIKYREQLGGFVNKQQLLEVYGVDSVKYRAIADNIRVDARHIRRISINKVDIEALRTFPYLNFKQMNAIIQYRKQHGNYQSVNDLAQVAILNATILRKIAPYLSYK